MSFQQKIVAAQRAIIDRLIEWEELIGSLYSHYAVRFPRLRKEWNEMAREEQEHAAALRRVHALFDQGHILEGIGEFNTAGIDDEIALVKSALKQSEKNNLRLEDAITTAREIEASVIEGQFYEKVQCRTPEFAEIAEKLRADTESHLDRLRRLRL